jgi:hypothetical protein
MDGKAIVENYRKMAKEPEFIRLDINQLKLHQAKYLIRLLEPVMVLKPGPIVTKVRVGPSPPRLQILKKGGQGIQECFTTDEYRHYMAFTLIPEVEETVNKYKYKTTTYIITSYNRPKSFDEVKPILEDLFPEMDLTEDPRTPKANESKPNEPWESFLRRHCPKFSVLLRLLYEVSYDLPEDAILSYLKGSEHDSWEITSNSE